MRKFLFLIIITAFGFKNFAQTTYKEGYFITNQGDKINCFIKDVDKRKNPEQFTYKLDENSTQRTATLETVKEFGFADKKFQRFTVDRDVSATNINSLKSDSQPFFKNEKLFLKVLLEGEASLFSYYNGNKKLYFFLTPNKEIPEQLIYKKYKPLPEYIAENNKFREQLISNVLCDTINRSEILNVDYKEKDLVEYFKTYNTCVKSDIVEYNTKKDYSFVLNLSLRPGIDYIKTDLHTYNPVKFEPQLSYRIGAEMEVLLPYNHNKWAATLEVNYSNYQNSQFTTNNSSMNAGFTGTTKINTQTIDVIFGARHYFLLNDSSKLFINGNVIFATPVHSEIKFVREIGGQDVESDVPLIHDSLTRMAFGAGYNYKNKYSIELRHVLKSEFVVFLTNNYENNMQSLSLILGYNFL